MFLLSPVEHCVSPECLLYWLLLEQKRHDRLCAVPGLLPICSNASRNRGPEHAAHKNGLEGALPRHGNADFCK